MAAAGNPTPNAANGQGNTTSTSMILPVHPTPSPNTTLIPPADQKL